MSRPYSPSLEVKRKTADGIAGVAVGPSRFASACTWLVDNHDDGVDSRTGVFALSTASCSKFRLGRIDMTTIEIEELGFGGMHYHIITSCFCELSLTLIFLRHG
jgi:hypothetical protein